MGIELFLTIWDGFPKATQESILLVNSFDLFSFLNVMVWAKQFYSVTFQIWLLSIVICEFFWTPHFSLCIVQLDTYFFQFLIQLVEHQIPFVYIFLLQQDIICKSEVAQISSNVFYSFFFQCKFFEGVFQDELNNFGDIMPPCRAPGTIMVLVQVSSSIFM